MTTESARTRRIDIILQRGFCRYQWRRIAVDAVIPLVISTLWLFSFYLLAATGNEQSSRLRPNIILLTIDTLRADHIGCYGYKLIQTPHIDALAAEGGRFSTVVAQTPLTLPSHCSILTGSYPMFHGVRDNVGYRLDGSKTTLGEMLKSDGYQTGAFVGAYVLDSKFGLNQGFDRYDDGLETQKKSGGIVNLNQLERRGEAVMNRAIDWMEGVSKAPFFAWIHLYDPHDPYDPPAPFKYQYKSRPYDGEIAYVDYQVGRLVSYLKSKGLYQQSLIVLTGDHGESFGEHQEFTHGYFIYDSTLLVPLIIKPVEQSFKNMVVGHQVRTVDIAPTILQMLGMQKAPDIQGTGLLELLLGGQRERQLEAYSETYYPAQFGWSPLRSLRQSGAKYIEAPKPELFDLAQDPGEVQNRVTQNAALANQMKSRLAGLENSMSDRGSGEKSMLALSAADLEKLGTLGYVGGPVRSNPFHEGTSSRADPKDKLAVFYLISKAAQNAANGRYAIAVPQLLKITRQEPGMVSAHFLLGRCFYNQKQYPPARNAFQQVVKLNPQNVEGLFYLAACDFYLKRLESAEAGFKKVLSLDPNYVYAHKHLGFIYQSRAQTSPAIREFQKVLEISPRDEEAHSKLGFLLASESRFNEAIVHFKKVIEINPSNATAHYNLGLAYLKTNQNNLAQVELIQACKLDSTYCKQNRVYREAR